MSWENLATVLKMTKGINSTEKYLLFMLAYYHNDEFDRCDPSVERLSRDVLRSKRHVQRTLRSLARRGIITIHERVGTSHQYDLQLLTREPDVTRDTMSPLTSTTRTREPDVTRTLRNIESSEDSSYEESSSSSEDEEDFMVSVSCFYSSLPTQLFLSSVQAPGPYFRRLQKNGDRLPPCDLSACLELAQAIYEAVNVGYPEKKILTFPTPAHLAGLAEAAPVLAKHTPRPRHLRLALYQFCQHDGGPEELSPGDILERIAKRPDLFAEALTQLSLSLG